MAANSKTRLKQRFLRLSDELARMLDLLERELVSNETPEANRGPLTDREHWILDQLRDGVELTRNMVEKQFEIGEKQAKRVLNPLVQRGLIKFVRRPRPGYYARLCEGGRS